MAYQSFAQAVEAKNVAAANLLKSVQFQRLVYYKCRQGKVVKAIFEGVA